MPLLDRVATLIKANLNDLLDKAEDPEKLLKQLLLDMQNQYMQVKTQTAMAIADEHLLGKKQADSEAAQAEWLRKANGALSHNDEDAARAALERSLTHETAAANFRQQREDQQLQVASLRSSLSRLEGKMTETRGKLDILIARHRRARIALGTSQAMQANEQDATLTRLTNRIDKAEALSAGYAAIDAPKEKALERLETLERNEKVSELLATLKRKALSKPQA